MFDVACGGADILKVIKFIWTLLDIVFFIVPIVLIVMISLDFAKCVIAGKDDDMRKNTGIVIKRIIYCVALFLVEPICALAIDMLGDDAAINGWKDSSGNNVGWVECIEIAIENDDFSDYEINWNTNNNNNGSYNNENVDSDNSGSDATDGGNASYDKDDGLKVDGGTLMR